MRSSNLIEAPAATCAETMSRTRSVAPEASRAVILHLARPALDPVLVICRVATTPSGGSLRKETTAPPNGPMPRSERLAQKAMIATPATIATTIVPWYWVADGVAMPARLQTSQIVWSGPISRPHL